jgi:hypothetical protein
MNFFIRRISTYSFVNYGKYITYFWSIMTRSIKPIDSGGSWSFFTKFLAKNCYLIQLLLTTHPIESLDSLNRAQISGQ